MGKHVLQSQRERRGRGGEGKEKERDRNIPYYVDYIILGLGRTRHFFKLTIQFPNPLRVCIGSSS